MVIVLSASATFAFACSAPNDDASEPWMDSSKAEAPLTGGGVDGLCGGERCDSVAHGAIAFFDRHPKGLGGNGRACADCHMVTDHFQLSPADVEARWQALQARREHNPDADDPLFRPIDADDFRVNGENASDFSELRQNGLVRVTFPLPSNVKLVGRDGNVTNETFVDVWRSVPSVFNVKITGPDGQNPTWPRGPNTQGGYQLDARFGTLQEQATGAFNAHAQVSAQPSTKMLDDIAAFERVLFSSDAARTISKAKDDGVSPLPDVDGPLTPDEQAGKAVFARSCGGCHGGAGFSTPSMAPPIRYHFIFSGCARPVDQAQPPRWQFAACPPRLARNIRVYQITLPNGQVIRKASSDPGRFLLTGVTNPQGSPLPPFTDDWEKFDAAPLRGIKNTAPYFHNNSADSLEAVVDHYEQFWKFVQAQLPATAPLFFQPDGTPRSFSSTEKPALLAYLRKL